MLFLYMRICTFPYRYFKMGPVAQMIKDFVHSAGELGTIPGLGRSPGERYGYPLQCSCQENPMDRGAWQVTVHGVAKSQTWQKLMLLYLKHYTWRRQWQPTPVPLSGKSHGQRSLVGCSPRGHEESDTTERLHFHFSLSCIGEGHGNPLQCSCLENPRDGGAWWAAVYGVAQSWTWLKWLSSSSSSSTPNGFTWLFYSFLIFGYYP